LDQNFQTPIGSTFDVTGKTYSDSNVIFKNNASYTRTINFKVTADGYWDVVGFFDPCYTATANWYATFRVHDGTGNNNSYYNFYTSPVKAWNTLPATDYNFNISQDVVVPANYVVSLLAYWGFDGDIKQEVPTNPACLPPECKPARIDLRVDNLCIIATELNSGEFASFCDVLRVESYLNRIIQKLTGYSNKLISDTFSKSADGCYWNNAITNGLRIRNAVTFEQIENGCGVIDTNLNKNILKTSFKKSFEGLDRIFCLGWAFEWDGLEWKIRVETRDYFYQNVVSQTFEHVGELNQMAKADKLVNHVVIGYSDNYKNRNIGGAFSIMTERNYFIGNRAMSENSSVKLDLRSEIIAEGYAIEISRRLQFYEAGAVSSDRPNDYDLFIIWLNRFQLSGSDIVDSPFETEPETGAYSFDPGTVSMPSDFITASNSPLSGLYNIYHTPARIACRWWKVLGMHTFKVSNPILRYQVGEYQVTYSSTVDGTSEKESCIEISGGAITENSNISAAILKDEYKQYLFKPLGVEFSYPQSLCDFLTLSQDEQYKKVRLTSGSLVIEGFIQEATNQPEDASGGTTKFNLIVSAQQSEPGGAFDTGFNDGYDTGN